MVSGRVLETEVLHFEVFSWTCPDWLRPHGTNQRFCRNKSERKLKSRNVAISPTTAGLQRKAAKKTWQTGRGKAIHVKCIHAYCIYIIYCCAPLLNAAIRLKLLFPSSLHFFCPFLWFFLMRILHLSNFACFHPQHLTICSRFNFQCSNFPFWMTFQTELVFLHRNFNRCAKKQSDRQVGKRMRGREIEEENERERNRAEKEGKGVTAPLQSIHLDLPMLWCSI